MFKSVREFAMYKATALEGALNEILNNGHGPAKDHSTSKEAVFDAAEAPVMLWIDKVSLSVPTVKLEFRRHLNR